MPLPSRLRSPDYALWAHHYPDGAGPSAFSAPAWQRLLAAEEWGGPEPLRWLELPTPSGRLHLPVLAHPAGLGRSKLLTRPVAYFVTPVERAPLEAGDLDALLGALGFDPRIAWLALWLPPWSPARPTSGYRGLGHLDVRAEETFVIHLGDGGAEAHLARSLPRIRRRGLAANERAGLELATKPSPAQREAYVALYHRIHRERRFVGTPFSRAFFEGAATELGRGGELCVALHRGRVVGGGILLYDAQAVHYFQGAVDREAREVSPHDALYLRALGQAERLGLGRVHLGGVNRGNTGLARFKRSWGAASEPFFALRWRCSPRVAVRRALGRPPGGPGVEA